MAFIKENFDLLRSFRDEQLSELVKDNDSLDEEKARVIKEEAEGKRTKPLRTSFVSVYAANYWWFAIYLISAFSCISYTSNRKAIKELLDAWPNIKDLVKGWVKR